MLVVNLLLFIIADYISRGQVIDINPTLVTVLENEEITFTCTATVKDNWRSTRFVILVETIVTYINNSGNCFKTLNGDPALYDGTCGTLEGQFILKILKIDDRFHNKTVQCIARYGTGVGSDPTVEIKSFITVLIPVTSLTLSPVDNNKTLSVISGEPKSLTCKTNSIRPAARIQWYIGGQNVTDNATISTEQDGNKFISTSTMVYTGREVDHKQEVYCKAVNIDGREKTNSTFTNLFIILPVTKLTIEPTGDNDVVSLVSGTNINFTCKTDLGRPSAWIQWYIGDQNVTNQATSVTDPDYADNTKFISTSTLVYIGKKTDHNKAVYCEAVNTEEEQKIKSENKTLFIIVPVPKVTFEPIRGSDEVRVVQGQSHRFTCITGPGRPIAWIHWYIGDLNVTNLATPSQAPDSTDQSMFISNSTFVYTGTNADHNKFIHCEAGNTKAREPVKTDDIKLYIMVFITNITMTTDMGYDKVNVESNEKHVFTCITDPGRPAALIQWYIGGQNVTNQASLSTVHDDTDDTKLISTSKLVYTGNDVHHDNVIHCEVDNSEEGDKIKTENKTLYIIVPITYVTLTPHESGSSITVNSGESENFTCKTDSSRPAARIQWYISGQNETNKASHKTQPNGTQFISSSSLTYIGNIRDQNQHITCNAFNIYGRGRNISIKETFNIRSSPTTEVNKSLPENIFVGTYEMLNLTLTIIANPSPNVTWTFTNGTTHGYVISRKDFNMTSVDNLRHVILYRKENPLQKDFGNYTIEVVNNIKPTFVHTFVVEPAQAPSKPLFLHAECYHSTPRINVSWTSNFDGGKPQHFIVFLFNVFTNIMIKSQNILDKGQYVVHHFHTHELDYDSNYIMYVEARNEYDRVNSSDHVNCTTSTKVSLEQDSSSAVIGGAAGSSAAVIAVVIVAIVMILRRRTKKKGDDKQRLNRLNERETKQDESDKDGLKDNPLYGTTRTSTEADAYGQFKRTPQKMKDSTVKSGNKIKKQWQKKGTLKKGIKLDVYENSEDLKRSLDKNIYGNVTDLKAPASSGYKIKRNKDGLIYADLDFATAESGKKFFVIGSENRTNYAMIDLTKKADPLSDNSDEEVKKISE